MSDSPPPDPAATMARNLADIARVLLGRGSVEQTLERVVGLAIETIEGCDEAGVCAQGAGTPRSSPASPLVLELDDLQTRLNEGPCIDALAGADSVYVHDLEEDRRWPSFAPAASAAGVRSALAYRLSAGNGTLGALQLFARLPSAFNATDRAQGQIFAAHAGMALMVAQGKDAERFRAENLQLALISREIIGQAQGILMERERITSEQAFNLLRHASQRLNMKLRDVAQELVDTGSVPGTAGPA
ncbi:MAG: GAF and ANTAR domain-containing protein [Actinomycetota bacterium]|nr:GAF and ANTAR domain-containing protein [Actinomycetota bacterium]